MNSWLVSHRDRWTLVFAMAFVIAGVAACEETLPEGQGDVAALCSPFRAVTQQFPFDIPPDVSNPGENLRARDKIEQTGFEVAALHDAVRIGGESQVTREFGRYAKAVEDALDDAAGGTQGLGAPSDWLRYQEELNTRESDAHATLTSELERLGVDLRAECG